MNIAEIITNDCANGTGIRISVFVSGCLNHCKGCFQPQTWDFEYGVPYTREIEESIIAELSKPHYEGITFLGGDPMEFSNQIGLLPLIERIKSEMPDKSIWIYTGYDYCDVIQGGKRWLKGVTDAILQHTDVIVDGRFDESQKDLRLEFRGSRNQRIIKLR